MASQPPLQVESSLFRNGETIPKTAAHPYAGGENISPDLRWTGGPPGTQSYAVTCWDPDAPTTVGFTHWVLFNLPPSVTSLDAGAGAPDKAPAGSVSGYCDWGDHGWGGMAPPPGDEPHHYHFTVWALDQMLELDEHTPYAKFRFMIRGHVLASGELLGRFGL